MRSFEVELNIMQITKHNLRNILTLLLHHSFYITAFISTPIKTLARKHFIYFTTETLCDLR